jgi:hypothetical protein
MSETESDGVENSADILDAATLTSSECAALVRLALEIGRATDGTLGEIYDALSPPCQEVARREAGKILGLLNWRILRPVHEVYPEVLPPGLFPPDDLK